VGNFTEVFHMADKGSYPQIPGTVWWGMREILQRTPSATINDRFLSVQLGVQEAAARQYLAELKRVGLLTDEGKATPVALRWRSDETYWTAVQEILKGAYPSGLLDVAPPEDAQRDKVVSWFMHEGLGSGSAGNKAATYLLIATRNPNQAPPRNVSVSKAVGDTARSSKAAVAGKPRQPRGTKIEGGSRKIDSMPLNINVQIHISADATGDQIESIFSAMRRYLYENSAT
jgi:hypothetical protein